MIRYTVAAICILLSHTALAVSVQELDTLERQAYKATTSFYVITLEAGIDSSKIELETNIQSFEKTLKALISQEESRISSSIASISDNFEEFKKFARKNNIAEDGYTDAYVIVDLNTSLSRITDKITHARTTLLDGREENLGEHYSRLARDMEKITMSYLSITSSIDSGDAIYTGDQDVDITAMATVFGEQIKAQLKATPNTAASYNALSNAVKTWRFIEKPLHNFREHNIPTIMTRFNQKIIDSLLVAAQTSS